ncbi:MAG: LL-diaminopimelate aminotransferase [Bacteroides sp.]|nr:LL-diaminopimelate aminotransferase [Bacteroides sp.]MCM1379499.1 LL-diaminopimelate aminotransferase [Bacteroides sp.]MCM1445898.1 LL-diaminopimelate aminotransferase [Prevotella sp.]
MIKVNSNFGRLTPSYLFSEVGRKIADFQAANPDVEVIRMSIGDVTRPICPAAVEALHRAADEQSNGKTFHGYGPEQGYDFLRLRIKFADYGDLPISENEIFISDGAKSDLGNIGDILAPDAKVAVTNPVYPVYVDTNTMAGREIEYLDCTEPNGFLPELPKENPDIIYLCYPNNPTGTAMTRAELTKWVNYALEHGALILFDSAYEIFITDPDVPHSIYEIDGATRCAIEFRSFSKTAGFTGMRCGYTVVPKELTGVDDEGHSVKLHSLWLRRQSTKFNGASYPIQRAAEAIYTPEGRKQILRTVEYYRENARLMLRELPKAGLRCFGGINAPYVWVKAPNGLTSWEFFDLLLSKCGVASTPGVGFGSCGEGYVRLTAFNTHANTRKALKKITDYLK